MRFSMAARAAAGIVGTCIALGVLVLTAPGQPASAAVRHHRQRVLSHVLTYNPDGVQLLCSRRERGELAIVTGDGSPFVVRCEADGPISVWDAIGASR